MYFCIAGATESNNISVKGVARFYKMKKNHIITTQTVSITSFFPCGKLFLFELIFLERISNRINE